MKPNSHALALNGLTQPLKIDEFATAIGISARGVKRLIHKKKIRSYKIGGLRRIPPSELEDFPSRQLEEAEV